MSLQTDQRTGLDELEALDFDYDPPCEHREHETGRFGHRGPAWALVEVLPLPCGCPGGFFMYLCKSAWETPGLFACEHFYDYTRDEVWRFVALVRP